MEIKLVSMIGCDDGPCNERKYEDEKGKRKKIHYFMYFVEVSSKVNIEKLTE